MRSKEMKNKFTSFLEKYGANKYKLALIRRIISDKDSTGRQSYTLAEVADMLNGIYDQMDGVQQTTDLTNGMDLNELKYHLESEVA